MVLLPTDILETILEDLLHDSKALCACALVSHTFCSLSQRLLYSRITLGSYKGCGSDPRLVNTLSRRPQIALYVRYLSIEMSSNVVRGRIIRMFTQIRSLIFYGEGMDWDEHPAEMRLAILDLFRVQSLTDISISGVTGFPCSSVFTRSPQLRRLAFESVDPRNDDDDTAQVITLDKPRTSGTEDGVAAMVGNQHTALESLDVRSELSASHEHILRSLITQGALPRLSSLRALRISLSIVDELEVDLIQKLLDNATDSLQDITFFVDDSEIVRRGVTPTLNLTALLQLSTLRISADDCVFGALSWFEQLLRTVPPVNSLEIITLSADVRSIVSDNMTWTSIDSIITSWTSHLRTICLYLEGFGMSKDVDLASYFLEKVPNLSRNGVLSVSVSRYSSGENCYVRENVF